MGLCYLDDNDIGDCVTSIAMETASKVACYKPTSLNP